MEVISYECHLCVVVVDKRSCRATEAPLKGWVSSPHRDFSESNKDAVA